MTDMEIEYLQELEWLESQREPSTLEQVGDFLSAVEESTGIPKAAAVAGAIGLLYVGLRMLNPDKDSK